MCTHLLCRVRVGTHEVVEVQTGRAGLNERENCRVLGGRVAEAEGRNGVSVQQGGQHGPQGGQGPLVRVVGVAPFQRMQALAAECLAPLPLVAGREVDAHNDVDVRQP